MNVLDSPLEALTFNYASFGFFTLFDNLWAWVAVLTAALSLWKICAKPHLSPPPPPSNDRSLNGSRSTEHEQPLEPFVPPEAPGTSLPAGVVVAAGDGNGEVDGVTKGKFTVYYEDDGECGLEEELMETEEYCNGGSGGCKSEWWESWDKMLEMRMGMNGWYMYQDLTELNGNVVRLWDAGFGDGTFPKKAKYSSSCIGW